eukprot:CAMPEP_0197045960 /NCGR_PEP_ID=MMETSP1384-20130603/21724_1 /TAXON_ID=29189 /ORGANISM="Ammonia sp." /LENGTH=466 /DNA_ID=CAMNT_0042477655 /DNA_START=63 /DNA_END=1460 /DNA_ORIENTATION=-
MYGEQLDSGGAAPQAFAGQDQYYDIEMDRYRANSNVNSHSHPAAVPVGFNDAVYIEEDANSVDDNELNHNKELPDMKGHHYYRSASVRDIEEPRDQWAANPDAPKPNEGLNCLWGIIVLCVIGAVAAGTTIDHSMMNIFIDMDAEGTYGWNLGWANADFFSLNNAKQGQATAYSSADEAEDFFPIPNTKIYMRNAGNLLIAVVLISLFLLSYILTILCSRCNSHILLYINCCCCRIPQRASVYFAFDVIKTFSWLLIVMYIVLAIYGLLETNFYLTTACPPGNTCWSYIVPHYGFAGLMCITFSISCFAFSRVQALDIKFNLKSMQLYFPENLRKAESRNCSLNLDMLFACISAMKNICIFSFIMFVSFRDVGLIFMIFYNETASTARNAVMFFQFQGLLNSHGIAENSYLELANSGNSNNMQFTTVEPSSLAEQSTNFSSIAQIWQYWIGLILVANLFVFLPYIW